MKPYYEFAKDSKSPDNIMVAQFSNGVMAAIIDRYCINPDCDCVAVGLEFVEIDESGKFIEKLFSCSVDTETWEISELQAGKTNVDHEFFIQEFSASLDSLKEQFKARLRRAKEYAKDDVLDWLDDVDLNDSRCFSYAQVYGENGDEYSNFLFEYEGRQYFIDDQYCSKPKCQCDEAILSFVNLMPDQKEHKPEFAVRVSLGTGDYKIDHGDGVGEEEIAQIYNKYREHINDDMGLLRSRYAKMKEYGRKRILRLAQKAAPKAAPLKAGRNDPCPCGSGKKYKKCCGINLG